MDITFGLTDMFSEMMHLMFEDMNCWEKISLGWWTLWNLS